MEHRANWVQDQPDHISRMGRTYALRYPYDTPLVRTTACPGSEYHEAGECEPCVLFHTSNGCRYAHQCLFCHLCPRGETHRRRRSHRQRRLLASLFETSLASNTVHAQATAHVVANVNSLASVEREETVASVFSAGTVDLRRETNILRAVITRLEENQQSANNADPNNLVDMTRRPCTLGPLSHSKGSRSIAFAAWRVAHDGIGSKFL